MTDTNNTNVIGIEHLLGRIAETFSRLDLAAWYQCFHHPHIILTPKGGLYAKSVGECEQHMGLVFEKLRQQGFVNSTLDYHKINQLTDSTAVVSAIWSRWGANNKLIQTFGATYFLSRVDSRWGISVLTTHSADNIVVS